MDATDLKVFEAVVRCGGMGRAAEALHTVQSNVTTRMRRLEAALGMPLFRRHARGVEPTPAGQRLLPYARDVGRLLAEARRAALDDGTPQGPLVIGSLDTTAALHLVDPLSRFTVAHPAVDLTLRTGTTAELIEQVLDRRLEGAFVCGPVVHPDLEARQAFTEELVLLTSAAIGSLADCSDQRIVVLRRGCSYRQRLEDLLARRGVATPRILEFGTLEAVFGCVAAGLGITLLPRAVIGPVWRDGRVVQHALPPHEAMVDTVFIRRRGGYRSSALAAFLALLPSPAAANHAAAAE